MGISKYIFVCFRKFAAAHKWKSQFATNTIANINRYLPACCVEGCHSRYCCTFLHSTPNTGTTIIPFFLLNCFPICSSTVKPAPLSWLQGSGRNAFNYIHKHNHEKLKRVQLLPYLFYLACFLSFGTGALFTHKLAKHPIFKYGPVGSSIT